VVFPLVRRWTIEHSRAAAITAGVLVTLFVLDVALESLGVWGPVKDALVPLGINHW
jgi:hypothetical protein